MKLEDIIQELKHSLSEKRFRHTGGVAASAKSLALRYGGNPEQAELAGWVHDCAKEMKLEDMQQWVKKKDFAIDEYMLGSRALLHGPAGSAYAELHFGIHDPEILSAVFYHTTGNTHMSQLEKIVFLADYIEPSRDFPGVDTLRKAAKHGLDHAVLLAYDSTIGHLIDDHEYIYELTFQGRNALLLTMQETDKK